ncbi:perilipin-5 [Planoprotostelium fungivorum]|uniref:Perilipin-5 n=1 Tax=Planoprotostelium fungivorum TaxID=1890364 RepID=A0A2P6NHE1_9EUKA|nr:perilipin-5 [Planoprotostelium fungivorum]
MPSDGAETSPITVESQALNRVLAYSAVKGAIDNAKTYYSAAKDYSPVVKSFSDSIEVRLGETARIVAPTVQKVQPLLNTADSFAVRQLDNAEKFAETLSTSSKAVHDRVSDVATRSVQTLENTVIPSLDSYLQKSPLSLPINLALQYSEQVVDRVLPEEKTETSQRKEGPLYRAGHLTSRVGSGLQTKYSDIRRDAPHYAHDLLRSARGHIETGLATTNTLISDPSKVSAAVSHQTKHALDQLVGALHILSAHIPEEYKNRTISVLKELRDREEVANLQKTLRSNAERLQHASEQLSSYIKSNERLPSQLSKVTDALTSVLESLLSHTEKSTTQ